MDSLAKAFAPIYRLKCGISKLCRTERSHDLFSKRLTVIAYGSKLDYGCWKRKSDELFYLIVITNYKVMSQWRECGPSRTQAEESNLRPSKLLCSIGDAFDFLKNFCYNNYIK